MTEQTAFAKICELIPADISWGDPITPQIAREIVQAATAAALERAAGVCQQISALQLREECTRTADECADAIRALKDADKC